MYTVAAYSLGISLVICYPVTKIFKWARVDPSMEVVINLPFMSMTWVMLNLKLHKTFDSYCCTWHKVYERRRDHVIISNFIGWLTYWTTGTRQLVTRSTRHIVKWCEELTVVSDGVVTSWPYFLTYHSSHSRASLSSVTSRLHTLEWLAMLYTNVERLVSFKFPRPQITVVTNHPCYDTVTLKPNN